MSSPANISPEKERNARWNVLKGVMLIILYIGHIKGYFPALAPYLKWSWAPFGFFSMGEAFVFISAVITAVSLRSAGDLNAIYRKLWPRIGRIYVHHLLLVIAAVLALANYEGGIASGDPTRYVKDSPLLAMGILATGLYSIRLLEILPLYMFFLLLTGPVVVLLRDKKKYLVCVLSAVLWLACQVFHPESSSYFNMTLTFNPLAWQFIFVLGLWYGVVVEPLDREKPTILFDLICLVIALYLFLLRHRLLVPSLPSEIKSLLFKPRNQLPVGTVINLLLFCRSLRLLSPLDYHRWPLLRSIGEILGKESLLVFSWSIFLYYALTGGNYNYPAASVEWQTGLFLTLLLSVVIPLAAKRRVWASRKSSAG